MFERISAKSVAVFEPKNSCSRRCLWLLAGRLSVKACALVLGETALVRCECFLCFVTTSGEEVVSHSSVNPSLGWCAGGAGGGSWGCVRGSVWTGSPLCCVNLAEPRGSCFWSGKELECWRKSGDGENNPAACVGLLTGVTFHRQDTEFRMRDNLMHWRFPCLIFQLWDGRREGWHALWNILMYLNWRPVGV